MSDILALLLSLASPVEKIQLCTDLAAFETGMIVAHELGVTQTDALLQIPPPSRTDFSLSIAGMLFSDIVVRVWQRPYRNQPYTDQEIRIMFEKIQSGCIGRG